VFLKPRFIKEGLKVLRVLLVMIMLLLLVAQVVVAG
jgi:hypothetical protein